MSLRTCPRSKCAELCPADATLCAVCGASLVPSPEMLRRWRVRGAIQWTAENVNADAHADRIVLDLQRRKLQPWPAPKRAA